MAIFRAALFSGLVAVAFLGVPGARAADPSTSTDDNQDDDLMVAGGGACNNGSIVGSVPVVFALAGMALRRRAR